MKPNIRRVILAASLSVAGSFVAASAAPRLSAPAGAAPIPFSITTNPPLDPSFNPSVPDYAMRCSGSPTTQVTTTGTDRGDDRWSGLLRSGEACKLHLQVGQELQVTEQGTSYYIRCLPKDFPRLLQLENRRDRSRRMATC